jgi:predicted nucleic acid-binding protein
MAAATYILWGGADTMAVSPAVAGLPIDVDPVSPEPVLEAVLPLASEHGISVYDAMYL